MTEISKYEIAHVHVFTESICIPITIYDTVFNESVKDVNHCFEIFIGIIPVIRRGVKVKFVIIVYISVILFNNYPR